MDYFEVFDRSRFLASRTIKSFGKYDTEWIRHPPACQTVHGL